MYYDHRSIFPAVWEFDFSEAPVEHIGEHLMKYGSPPSFKTSAVMLSFPGALFLFTRLMAALTSVGRMGGGGVLRVL